ncbi:MAG TPA: hypothetical protein VGN55_01250 [Xanthobacteraceae bacterium]|jgi:hypothetical protein
MALRLLHRFSNLERQILIDDWKQQAPTLVALEQLLWPLTQPEQDAP